MNSQLVHWRFFVAMLAGAALAPVRSAYAQQATGAEAAFMRDTAATLTLEGYVRSVRINKEGTTFLNFGPSWPHQTFAAIIFPSAAKAFPNPKQWTGKRVRVTGKLKEYQKRPAMVLQEASQLEAAPAPRSPM